MNTSDVPKEILARATDIIHASVDNFPEDTWVQIDENFELHLFIREDEFRYQTAELHKVRDRNDSLRIWDQHVIDDEYNQFAKEQNVQMEAAWFASREPLGLTYSRLNPHGVFTPDGQQIGSTCNCEDYPCCGH